MRIYLLNPPFYGEGNISGHGGHVIPLNLCYLAAYLRRSQPGHDVRIIDGDALGWSTSATVERVVAEGPDILGITANTCVFDQVMKISRRVKARLPGVKVVVGGPHVSALPRSALSDSAADFAVRGEGEQTFSELVAALDGGQPSLDQIAGLIYRVDGDEEGEYAENPPRALIQDLDSIPLPARDLVDNHLYRPAPTKRVGPGANTLICTSRGCPYDCGFCGASGTWGRRIRMRSPESVVEEIRQCVTEFGIRSINISDENFTASQRRVRRICELLVEQRLNVPWVCMARADRLEDQTLTAMREAGCRQISFGIESGNEAMLERIDKRLDLGRAADVVRRTQKAGIKTHASYIIGYLGETEASVRDTIEFSQALDTDVAAFFIASPLPGSRFYDEAKADGLLREDATWADYSPLTNNRSVVNLPTLDIDEIRRWHRKAIWSYYLRPRYLLKRITRLRRGYELANLLGGLRVLLAIRR